VEDSAEPRPPPEVYDEDLENYKRRRCRGGCLCWRDCSLAYVRGFLLIMWDGMGFFGFDDTKLARLKGHPVSFMRTKFSSIRWTLITILSFALAVSIIYLEGRKIGLQKTQAMTLDKKYKFSYEVSQGLPLMLCSWFYIEELIRKAKGFQASRRGDQKMYQHAQG
jgi:hypothetical protein